MVGKLELTKIMVMGITHKHLAKEKVRNDVFMNIYYKVLDL